MNTNTFTKRQLLATLLSLVLLSGHAAAQVSQAAQTASSAPSVTAAATDAGMRFTATGEVLQIRLEIYAVSGELVFDSGARAGGILDWKATDVQQGIADGSYIAVLTFKDLSGRNARRIVRLDLQQGRATLARTRSSELNAAQAQALAASAKSRKIEVTDADDSLAIVHDGREHAVTITTHDGQNGQVTSVSGALTLRTGDTLTGQDKEQVRITPDGRVGIGTSNPEATLDVAGEIRARGGIRFDDGTVLTSARGVASGTSFFSVAAPAADGQTTANLAGTGTANRLAKWMDGTGTLGDSALAESNGNIGIGTTTPANRLDVVRGSAGQMAKGFYEAGSFEFSGDMKLGIYSSAAASPNAALTFGSTNLQVAGRFPGFEMQYLYGGTSAANQMRFNYIERDTAGAVVKAAANLLTIKGNGDVTLNPVSGGVTASPRLGIGTDSPQSALDVIGNVRVGGAGNGIIFPDGTKQTTAAGAGGTMTGTSIISAINDPATAGVVGDNRLSSNVARLGGANAWSGLNVFGAGLSANNALVTNVGNPVAAGDATNKGYVDANFIRFVPGAEQLSVGDANGTAAMINLRGGSTCCSSPGGHTPAFFKVFQNGSFVATGNLGIGVSPLEGKGYRTSWYTYKGAFRSGYADNEWDDANTGFFSWAGGSNSTASGLYAFAFGDTNFALSTSSIVFGSGNEVKGAAGFSAGAGNRVCDTYGVAFGNKAQSGGPLVNGKCDPETFNIRGLAAVAIGYNVTADQDHTTAMGKFASNNGFSGTFIWSDGSATASADTFRNTANNEFAARATGGFRFRTNLTGTTGCNLPAGSGVFNCTSSRYTKENFLAISGEDVLSRLRKVPVSSWNYIAEGRQVRHLGPMAEDFYGAFGLGTSDKAIGIQDLAGINLAAAQALDQRTAALQKENAQLRTQLSALEQRLAALEQSVQTSAPTRRAKARRR